ncbi:ABC transporter B family member 29, chloroplastic isoform X1 [Selaginella moellendorffii]|uniref:ABC transporter B family member 29, chloroplastic isoform X1 n=1 Tax=Selaginella moellendorffii TaxID=88036 RepID=UPI000D1CDB66|nr:ABC transporter B family member 29, chloroplastic isoform X1 [Selaginella moellendorffii]|eukprot:XP_024536602.1 ABC transporter B family member 29, chloroplastic isoform X1 [Selaginella moellendorffii]
MGSTAFAALPSSIGGCALHLDLVSPLPSQYRKVGSAAPGLSLETRRTWRRRRRGRGNPISFLIPAAASSSPIPAAPGLSSPPKENFSLDAIALLQFLPLSKTLPKILPLLRPQIPRILSAWACAAVSVSALYAFVPQVGQLSSLLAAGDLVSVRRKAAMAIFLISAKSLAQYWQQALLWEVALGLTCDVRCHVFETVLRKDMSYFEGQSGAAKGDIAYRITAEADATGETIYAFLKMVVPCFLQLAAMAGRMLSLSPVLSFATVSVVPCMSVVIAILGEQLRALSKRGQDSIARLSAYVNEVLPSMLIVKACAAESYEDERFKRLAVIDRQAHLMKKKMKAFIPEIITGAYAATGVVLFALGAWVISKGNFDGTGMVSFITSLVLLIEPIQQIGKAYNEMKQGEPAVERLFDLTASFPKILDEEASRRHLKNVIGDVVFDNVCFSYGATSPRVLQNINFHVCAGETVALVGPSGGGKTTLAKLLLRLYEPTQGNILIDGENIQGVSLESLRQQVAIVPQETALFTGTVMENIAYGVMPNDIDMKRVERAATMANADEFIRRLPDGYETNLGERGSSLSGGQRQRIAIARAIYHGPSILILDEATSALDNRSEKLVREALEQLMIGRTVFIIAHRLETVQKAARIFLLDGGKLVEEGTHSSLIARGGQYASLFSAGRDDVRPQLTAK